MTPRHAHRIPPFSTVPALVRDPLRAVERLGAQSGGRVVRVDLGLFRPYLVTRPEHVQHVLRDHSANYRRDGMMWRPLRRLFGDTLGGEGEPWQTSRQLIAPQFAARTIDRQLAAMATTINETVDQILAPTDESSSDGPVTVDAELAMTRIVHAALVRVMFGGRITHSESRRLGAAVTTAFTSITWRMLLPFLPESVPVPGDRAFAAAVADADDVLFPLVRRCRRDLTEAKAAHTHPDIVSTLCRARDETGQPLPDRVIRDDVMAMFGGGTETTAVMLTWLWVVVNQYPHIAARLYREIDDVVGRDPVCPDHLPELRYTNMVLQELLRLYPVGWMIPRAVAADDVLDSVRVTAGSTVILSPYLTQRMPELWPDPLTFDPNRFSPDRTEQRHRFAYFPFSGGPHQCLGGHLFLVEAQLIAAAVLSRCRPRLVSRTPRPKAAVSLRPDRRVRIELVPVPTAA